MIEMGPTTATAIPMMSLSLCKIHPRQSTHEAETSKTIYYQSSCGVRNKIWSIDEELRAATPEKVQKKTLQTSVYPKQIRLEPVNVAPLLSSHTSKMFRASVQYHHH
jgi:hypothetical protein